jgi:hypothetical protein
MTSIQPNISYISKKTAPNLFKNTVFKRIDNYKTKIPFTTAYILSNLAKQNNKISDNELAQMFLSHNYKQNKKGEFKKKFSLKDFIADIKFCGSFWLDEWADIMIEKFKKVTKQKQANFKDFLEIKNNKQIAQTNFEKMYQLFTMLNMSVSDFSSIKNMIKGNENLVQVYQNFVKNPPNLKEYGALKDYKRNTYIQINNSLRKNDKTGLPIKGDIKTYIKVISNYINTQVIKNPIKLYRIDNIEDCLQTVKMEDGSTINLGEMMVNASKAKNQQEEILKIKEFILDHKLTAKQPAFMSTSSSLDFVRRMIKDNENYSQFEFTTKPNTKGCFEDVLSCLYENEVLLQKGSVIEIKDIDFKGKNWKIKAEVSN